MSATVAPRKPAKAPAAPAPQPYPGLLRQGSKGAAVRTLQQRLNAAGAKLDVDGEFGPATAAAVRSFQSKRILEVDGIVGRMTWAALWGREPAPAKSLHEKAYRVALSLLAVREVGGNNRGPMVMKIIRANGGGGPEPWCGDFVAYCYRLAGSKRVNRSWAAVRLLRGLLGMRLTRKPVRGDLVIFTWSHVGLYSRDLGGGRIETVEGNTKPRTRASDSGGGEGVHRMNRGKNDVRFYLHVMG